MRALWPDSGDILMPGPDGQWHLDKRVPMALIFAIGIQTAGVAWFLAGLDGAVARNIDDIAKIETRQTAEASKINMVNNRLIRVEEQNAAIKAALQRIERLLDRQPAPRQPPGPAN